MITFQYQSNSEIKETPTEDCVLDCPKTDKPCNHATCCGPSKQVCVSNFYAYYFSVITSAPSLLQYIPKSDTNPCSTCPKSICLGRCLRAINSDSNSVIGNCLYFTVQILPDKVHFIMKL